MAMGLAHDFQGRIMKKRLGETQDLLGRYQKPETAVWFEKKLEKYRQGMRQKAALRIFRMLKAMEVLKEGWMDELQRTHHLLYTTEESEYQNMRREWKKLCEKQGLDLSVLREQLLVYYVFTYFAGAVYDGHAYGKMKLAAAATVLTEEIAMARALSGRKDLAENDFIWTAHLISKEIEHSDQNLNRLERLLTPVGLEELFTLLI